MKDKSFEGLKKLREEYGYSLSYMAELLGISKSYYCQIEQKKRRLYYEMAKKIAFIFDLKPDDLFYEEYQDN
ncbi:MAG: helix-turn-helix transcriptional regulator [Bacilli bacterium]|nr:helix-turn-helix transcriptional regulator [Bacilli bacterium]